jgi:3-hydroxyisobutyrate dehydrogenase
VNAEPAQVPFSPGDTVRRVGVIGLGQIGRGVAMTLARRGHQLAVYDVRSDAADDLPGVPGLCRSAREVAEAADTIFLCVVDAPQIRALIEGPEGLLAGRRTDTVLVVMSTISLDDLRSLRSLVAAHDLEIVDAGVTGGPAAAASGNLVVFLGGEDSTVQATLPVVQGCCGTVVHVGGPGTGMAAKIARNVVSYGCFRAAYEGGLLAERSAVDLHQFATAIRASEQQYGGCTVFIDRRGTVGPIEDAGAIAAALHLARLAAKDLSAAAELAAELGVELPLANVTAEHYSEVLGLATRATVRPQV